MKFAEFAREDRRLQILIILEAANYAGSEYLIHHALDGYGHAVTADALKSDLAWLDEQGLIELSSIDGAMVAKLTNRGYDASKGIAIVPGVKRPRPE